MRIRASLLLLAIASSATAQSTGPGNSRPDAPFGDVGERTERVFTAYDHTNTPGCAVGVSLDGAEVVRSARASCSICSLPMSASQ
jgi:hypothetical protein